MNNKKITLLLSLVCVSSSMFAMIRLGTTIKLGTKITPETFEKWVKAERKHKIRLRQIGSSVNKFMEKRRKNLRKLMKEIKQPAKPGEDVDVKSERLFQDYVKEDHHRKTRGLMNKYVFEAQTEKLDAEDNPSIHNLHKIRQIATGKKDLSELSDQELATIDNKIRKAIQGYYAKKGVYPTFGNIMFGNIFGNI